MKTFPISSLLIKEKNKVYFNDLATGIWSTNTLEEQTKLKKLLFLAGLKEDKNERFQYHINSENQLIKLIDILNIFSREDVRNKNKSQNTYLYHFPFVYDSVAKNFFEKSSKKVLKK